MTPSYALRLAKYHHKIEGVLPVLNFKQAKFIGKAIGVKGTHHIGGGFHPGENEFELVEAINSYNYERSQWEKKYGTGTAIAIPD